METPSARILRQQILELLNRESKSHTKPGTISRTEMMANRDENMPFDFIEGNGFDEKDLRWKLWFAYWLGREHGRMCVVDNARIYIEQGRPLTKAFLEAMWIPVRV